MPFRGSNIQTAFKTHSGVILLCDHHFITDLLIILIVAAVFAINLGLFLQLFC